MNLKNVAEVGTIWPNISNDASGFEITIIYHITLYYTIHTILLCY